MSSNRAKIGATAASLSVLAVYWGVNHATGSEHHESSEPMQPINQTSALPSPTPSSSPSPTPTAEETSASPTPTTPTPSPSPTPTPTPTPSPTKPKPTTTKPKPAPPPPPKKLRDGLYFGSSVPYQYGSLAVTIRVQDGQIADVMARANYTENRSQQIQNAALPVLRSQIVGASGNNINTVSGATYTSQAYRSSLQSALDSAYD